MDKPDRPNIALEAHCACGAVTVSVAGAVMAMLQCSCEHCQKASGGGHASIFAMAAEDVRIGGSITDFAQTANSGSTLTRSFCPVCGTPILGRSSRAPGRVMLPVGLFGADAVGWYKPGQLIFARSHRDWDLVDPALPQHTTYRGEA